jgi:ComF family protein
MSISRMLALLYPGSCCVCRSPNDAFCANCCPAAEEAHVFAVGALRCRSAGSYAGALRQAILACKRGRRDVAETLGRLLVERGCVRASDRIAALVPVPTTQKRRAERGFDQGVALALAASRASGIPVLASLRQADGEPQRGRSRAARLRPRRRFLCDGASVLPGLRVWLVDDVATTGATLRDCASALRQAGADVRGAAVVAHAALGAEPARPAAETGGLEKACRSTGSTCGEPAN